jgi:tRNA U55 pseudouridine synthase TruB
VHCGSGTYIRSIARESGETIKVPRGKNFGCSDICVGGTLSALSRIRNGIFHIQASLTFDEIDDKLQVGRKAYERIDVLIKLIVGWFGSTGTN